MFPVLVQFTFGPVRPKAYYAWSWIAARSTCSHSVADIDVVIGDIYVENFPKLDDFFGKVFFRRLGNAVNFKIVFSGVLL